MERVAVIGTGIAGLGCARLLHPHVELTLFEQDAHVGGHSNTVEAEEPGTGRRLPIDTGFMVFNKVTYPRLTRLFGALGVPIKPTRMSFGFRDDASGLEWSGASYASLFAQRRNLLRPRFWRMLAAADRFNREAVAALEEPGLRELTLGEYLARRGYGRDLLELYVVPMGSAVWSTPPDRMLEFPAATFLRFFHNHGFLGMDTQHPWWTVTGGSREYVRRLVAPFADRIRAGRAVRRVERRAGGVHVTVEGGRAERFDRVVLAAHADQALALLADPTPRERRVLGAFRYQPNTATLHTDARVMPRRKRAWAAWNYQLGPQGAATHYWMNALQGVSEREDYFVSINRPEQIDPAKRLQTLAYTHPLLDQAALAAQAELPALNADPEGTATHFAGSYFGYGFHEDALRSGEELAEQLLGASAPARAAGA